MHEQVANRHLAGHPRVVHLKARQVIDHLVVPADFSLIDENAERSHGEGLAGRAGRENCVGVDPLGRTETLDAESLGERDLVVLDDGDGHAGHADLLAQTFHAGVEAGRRRGEGRRDPKKRQ